MLMTTRCLRSRFLDLVVALIAVVSGLRLGFWLCCTIRIATFCDDGIPKCGANFFRNVSAKSLNQFMKKQLMLPLDFTGE